MEYPDRPKPRNSEELQRLIDAHDIEILLSEDIDGQLTRLLICDNRRSYDEGELYEIIV